MNGYARGRGPCGKLRYDGARSARLATARASNRLRTYFCRDCGAWHVTDEEKTMAGREFRAKFKPGKTHR